MTKLKVKEVELTHKIEGDEPWPEEESSIEEAEDSSQEEAQNSDGDSTQEKSQSSDDDGVKDKEVVDDEKPNVVEFDVPKKKKKDDDKSQIDLFGEDEE